MGSELGMKEVEGSSNAVAGDGSGDTKPVTMNGNTLEERKTNGHVAQNNDPSPEITAKEEQLHNGSGTEKTNVTGKSEETAGGVADISSNKPISTVEDDTSGMPPADSKVEEAVSGGAALADETQGLGSILKGSAFEQQDEAKAAETPIPFWSMVSEPQTQQDETETEDTLVPFWSTASKPQKIPFKQAKAPSTGAANGKSTDAQTTKPGSQSKGKADSRPATIETKAATRPAPSNATEKSGGQSQKSNPTGSPTPNSPTTYGKQPMSATAPPKAAPPKEAKKDAREIKKPANRLSTAPKLPTTVTASKPAPKPAPAISTTSKPIKKPSPTSPSAFVKPGPKSPTRPVRLPGSATAPTAASAAKLDVASTASKVQERASSNSASTRLKPKSSRASLPAGSKLAEKKSHSRLSTASSKAPEGSFLERMMRPTASSASKAHEKAEGKIPPKKAPGMKPKRTSVGSEKSKSENIETKGEQPHESATEPVQQPADASEVPHTDEANDDAGRAATTLSAEVPAQ